MFINIKFKLLFLDRCDISHVVGLLDYSIIRLSAIPDSNIIETDVGAVLYTKFK